MRAMKTIEEIRQENLKAIIKRFYNDTARQYALAAGISPNIMNRFFKPKGHKDFRPINDDMRGWIEAAHSLEKGWMDMDHSLERDPFLKELASDLELLPSQDEETAKTMIRDIVAALAAKKGDP